MIPNNKMDIELTPDDLDLNQEYNLTFYSNDIEYDGFKINIKNIDKYDGIYTLKCIEPSIYNVYYIFKNIESEEIITLHYEPDRSSFRKSGTMYCRIVCNIFEIPVNEYVLK